MQNALDNFGYAEVGPGTYKISSAITVPANAQLSLNGATIEVDYEGPGIILDGNRSRVIGDRAKVVALKDHTGPIVQVKSGFRFRLEDLWITGTNKSQIGLQIDDLSSTNSTFFGVVRDLQINNVELGILLTENVNGNEIFSPLMWNVDSCFIRFRGAYANRVIGGFAHGSGTTDGVVVLEFDAGTLNGNTVGSTHNQVIAFAAEPGGTTSKQYEIDADSTDNQIVSQLNVAVGPYNDATNNWGVRRGDREVVKTTP